MNVFAIIGFAVTAAVVCVLLKSYRPEYAVLISIGCCVLIFSVLLTDITPALERLRSLLDDVTYNSVYLEIVIKSLGVCYVTQLASDACADAGQSAIAGKVELAGKFAVILLSMPLFTNLLDTVSGLLTG